MTKTIRDTILGIGGISLVGAGVLGVGKLKGDYLSAELGRIGAEARALVKTVEIPEGHNTLTIMAKGQDGNPVKIIINRNGGMMCQLMTSKLEPVMTYELTGSSFGTSGDHADMVGYTHDIDNLHYAFSTVENGRGSQGAEHETLETR